MTTDLKTASSSPHTTNDPSLSGAELIAQERQRQIDEEGWSAEHDDQHVYDEMALAAACYALPRGYRTPKRPDAAPALWPWHWDWWKPAPPDASADQRIRELVKAGALIAAEIDRLQRRAGDCTR